ncbi:MULTISPECIES: hypothetical protein [Nocardia]|jgi:hypothetical protein|uniref:Uncharacterized protein n=1 Tax=Nocardia ignorata TaxID=145285 RepID=A0A4R6PKH4_NOCIG|nr:MULTISPECIES: hypothetical protein [Nocardia]MBC7300099.1 hypothetical protein [Nocardia sp.]TDP38657.1 hypothetical protein DFR75_103314 [Nocardia ignorata]
MSARPRRPVIGGIAGGVGTTTVAHLLDGIDVGVIEANGTQAVDVLVTRATAVAVSWAIATAQQMLTRPVLVVVADSEARWPSVVQRRLKMAATNLDTPVLRLGWLSPLAASDNPWDLLSTGVFDADRKTYRWAEPARKVRDELAQAVRTAIDRETPTTTATSETEPIDEDEHERPVLRVT